jgi:hypothetical protein
MELQERIPIPISAASGLERMPIPMAYGTGRVEIHIIIQRDESHIDLDELFHVNITHRTNRRPIPSSAYQTMLASEAVLARDWNQPDEDKAWATL